jgi:hypothetical protein
MYENSVHVISEEALAIKEALNMCNGQAAMNGVKRILQVCEEFKRDTKRQKVEPAAVTVEICPAVPTPTKEDHEQALAEKNAQDLMDKPGLQAESRLAGEFEVPFGKYNGDIIRALPPSYLCWLMGVRREGRTFQPVSTKGLDWIRGNQFETLSMVKKYLTWRCWACGSTDVRFKHAKLCTSCWHEG